ncbi:MAG: GDP-mannose 4,6-dehydratase [Treponema sp.]|nr:GDP-mannose 4,6-dehydratase [Treponema sp.]
MEKGHDTSTVNLTGKTVLVTGAAGFIGSFLCRRLLESVEGIKLVGLDSITDYYDVSLKYERLSIIESMKKDYVFIKGDISDRKTVDSVFEDYRPSVVVNLAAQAGVRYSITNPDAYISSNIIGFYNILEACREYPVEHLVYASSSSVYGSNKKVPYSTSDRVDNPVSLYAATKKSNELFAHAYSKLYSIPSTGLRFFTVYGPLGRPDMAYFKFTDRLVRGETIQLYNNGDMYRDFTYIDDIVNGIVNVMKKSPELTEGGAPYKVYNIGNSSPVLLSHFVEILESCLLKEGIIDKPGKKEYLQMQSGDVYQTYADVSELERDFNFRPSVSLENGLSEFASWYAKRYKK